MSYPLHTYTILSYIESHIKEQAPDYKVLENQSFLLLQKLNKN